MLTIRYAGICHWILYFEMDFALILVSVVLSVGCSHQRAWEYFVESIQRPNAFLATQCEPNAGLTTKNRTEINCDKNITAYMGFNADTR